MEDKHTVICAWCGKLIEQGSRVKPASHGICQSCLEKQLKELSEYDKDN